jgi:hypothetical protein
MQFQCQMKNPGSNRDSETESQFEVNYCQRFGQLLSFFQINGLSEKIDQNTPGIRVSHF